jgi:hypothetical protein
LLALAVSLVSTAAATSKQPLRPPVLIDHDDRSIPEPNEREISELYAITYNSWLRHLSPAYKLSKSLDPGSLNVNAWDEVADSTWFTNRIGTRPMSFEEIVSGQEGHPPEPGTWKIVRSGNEGYTPSFYIRDSEGRVYYLKFDLAGASERNSAAERICTLIMHAAGYHVPLNNITYFRAPDLMLDEKSHSRDALGKRHLMRKAELDGALAKLQPLPDSRLRAMASLLLPGNPWAASSTQGGARTIPTT